MCGGPDRVHFLPALTSKGRMKSSPTAQYWFFKCSRPPLSGAGWQIKVASSEVTQPVADQPDTAFHVHLAHPLLFSQSEDSTADGNLVDQVLPVHLNRPLAARFRLTFAFWSLALVATIDFALVHPNRTRLHLVSCEWPLSRIDE